ncbi:O-fucosyltransferase 36-like [Magnolia sinica]|uniref:O-fucosyltransferase 36-like n=1 Tax=Magnolia sinica TaxID=86752 RepID=UPI00265B3E5C|nr:O-fucosyltransferase 36-like [Magnolia sinica]
MDRESYNGEEDERGNFISPNSTNQIHRSTFEIGKFKTCFVRDFTSNKKYLFAICIPLLLIFIVYSVDLPHIFPTFSTVHVNSHGSNRMQESELQALYLLRNQQLALFNLWNRTLTYSKCNSSNSNLNSSLDSNSTHQIDDCSPSISFDDFRSALLNQIKLNKEIQQTLLSVHHAGNTSESVAENVGPALGSFSLNTCQKADRTVGRTIEWKPKANRYLFTICLSGQMSNHLICLQKHMFFAALLNRILVFPSPKFDYHYSHIIDFNQINKCFGRKVVISFEEFVEIKKNHLHIDRFICYIAVPPCFVDNEHVKRLKSLGLSMGKLEAAWPEDAKSEEAKKRVIGDIMPKFSCDDEVLAIGDMFYANVEEEWVMQPGGPLAHKCQTVIQPSQLIVLTAQRFVQTFLGVNYIALHFRRHGFLKFCNVKKESCFFPVPQAAECILRVVERANAPVIYLSTDAAESETDLLQALTMRNSKTIPLVKRPGHSSSKWDALLYRNHISGDDQVEAMLDKTICAMSNVFIGSSGSTFTEDIFRLRKDWGSASVCDEYMCQGEQPDFIADTE